MFDGLDDLVIPPDKIPCTLIWLAASEQETEVLGRALGESLEAGSIVALNGNLGAGKTRLVRAIAAALGVSGVRVTSPTFVLIHEYAGRLPVYHFDTYRLRDIDEFLELGADELLQSEGVCLVEWADRVAEALPEDLLRIEIEIAGETARLFRLAATGPRARRLIERVRERLERASGS